MYVNLYKLNNLTNNKYNIVSKKIKKINNNKLKKNINNKLD